jgi:C4-dicarboxylate-specific signal transduction histidine kinase
MEQLMINLLRNAADAALQQAREAQIEPWVQVAWSRAGYQLRIEISDNGPGISNAANLFVPFFTTKPGGSGIGLVLCRQIAEAHGGSLTLQNRDPGPGCVAIVEVPVGTPP